MLLPPPHGNFTLRSGLNRDQRQTSSGAILLYGFIPLVCDYKLSLKEVTHSGESEDLSPLVKGVPESARAGVVKSLHREDAGAPFRKGRIKAILREVRRVTPSGLAKKAVLCYNGG
ncbi:MAG: hypothetical protein UY50_C0031G0005 [Parcubacteria group bacterium GW2011_GWA2_49_9]|nr:MAG: hypothetical protein UY50_C0031G0005 [Parcubacteria group bacterium GW2011_GWA2_49_9]